MKTAINTELIESNFKVIKSVFRMEERLMQILGAIICAAQGSQADAEKLRECRSMLKSEHGIFSNFRGHMSLPIIVRMSLAPSAKEYLDGITSIYNMLNSSFALKNEFRLLAAMIIYDGGDVSAFSSLSEKTVEIYKKIRKNHPLLTSQDDMPFAAITAMNSRDADGKLEDIEACYKILGSKFPFAKNPIQTVSHILALTDESPQEKCENFIEVYKTFKSRGLRLTGIYLPVVALVANTGLSPEQAAEETLEYYNSLKKIKGIGGLFGVGSLCRRTFAASITALNNISDSYIAEGTVASTVISVVIAIEVMIMVMIVSAANSNSAASHS